jgi:hypothetical protein
MKKKPSVKLLGYRKDKDEDHYENDDFLKTLKQERVQKTDISDKLVNKIVGQIITSIKYYNSLGKTECIEEIPYIMSGFPLYNVSEITAKVNSSLIRMKLKSEIVNDSMIYISWS